MSTPLAKGVIIAASVLVAASIAAYENQQFREWLEKSSQKVALAFRSIGDDLPGRRRAQRQDSSMNEDQDEKAEERRRQARQEIMDKRRVLQEKRDKVRSPPGNSRAPSFDSMVDEEGRLKPQDVGVEENGTASSSAIEPPEAQGLRNRQHQAQMHESVDAPMMLRQLNSGEGPSAIIPAIEPWESRYEQEMRNAWNIELPQNSAHVANSRLSESLIDLTPTTEDFPDPDYSVPSLLDIHHGDIDLSRPMTPLEPRPIELLDRSATPMSHASVAGSTAHIRHSDAEMTDDDLSDFGDGIRTPASAWTEVGSSVSGDD